jgi:DnaJ homolog subfamily C member 28
MRRWESLVERQIREAADEGKFDDLPHQGRPLPLEDDSAAGEWAMAYRMLKDAGAAPPWIEADKAVRELLERKVRQLHAAARVSAFGWPRARATYAALVDEANAAIARVNAEAPTDRQHRRPLDREAELAAFEGRRSTP